MRLHSNNGIHFDIQSKLLNREIQILRHKANLCKSLEDCLSNFTQTERLRGGNKWICDLCHQASNAYKQIDYLNLPQTLIIHLKRFRIQCKKNHLKIRKLIKFPMMLILNMKNELKVKFKLYGVINHLGDTERGHYTAYCKENNSEAEWMLFDDSKLS